MNDYGVISKKLNWRLMGSLFFKFCLGALIGYVVAVLILKALTWTLGAVATGWLVNGILLAYATYIGYKIAKG